MFFNIYIHIIAIYSLSLLRLLNSPGLHKNHRSVYARYQVKTPTTTHTDTVTKTEPASSATRGRIASEKPSMFFVCFRLCSLNDLMVLIWASFCVFVQRFCGTFEWISWLKPSDVAPLM